MQHLRDLNITEVKACHIDGSGTKEVFVHHERRIRATAWRQAVKKYNKDKPTSLQIFWAGTSEETDICANESGQSIRSSEAYLHIQQHGEMYLQWNNASLTMPPQEALKTNVCQMAQLPTSSSTSQGGACILQSVKQALPPTDPVPSPADNAEVGDKRQVMDASLEVQLQLARLSKEEELTVADKQGERKQHEAEQQRNTILKIRNCSEAVMSELQNKGLSEKCHEKALSIALNKAGLCHRTQVECHEEFMGEPLTTLYADLVVEDVVVELKVTAHTETKKWTEQVLRYMSSLSKLGEKKYVGLIVNFNKGTGKVDFTEVGPECTSASSAWVVANVGVGIT